MAIGRTVMTGSPLVSTRRRSDGHLRRLDQRQTFRAERKWLAVGRSTFATHRANLTGPPRPGIPTEVEGDERVIGFAMLASRPQTGRTPALVVPDLYEIDDTGPCSYP